LQQDVERWREGAPCEVIVLRLTSGELRALVSGAGCLGVRTSSLLAWAGIVNPGEVNLPRWQRPFVSDEELLRYVTALDARAVQEARELATQFAIDVESYLTARAFHWLRRIRAFRLEDPRWQQLDIPAPRVPWRRGERSGLL